MSRVLLSLVSITTIMSSALSFGDYNFSFLALLSAYPLTYAASVQKEAGRSNLIRTRPNITSECERRGFCERGEVFNYPEELAEKLILEGKVPIRIESSDDADARIGDRLSPDTTEYQIEICQADRKTIYPKILLDQYGTPKFVVNSDKIRAQGVYVELCHMHQTTQRPLGCNSLIYYKEPYSVTGCMQQYIYKVFDIIEGRALKSVYLRVPACCTCGYYVNM